MTLVELSTSRSTSEERRDRNLELTVDVIYLLRGADDPLDEDVRAEGPQYADAYDGVQPLYVIARKWEVLLPKGGNGLIKLTVTFGHPSRLVVSENEIELSTMADTVHLERAIDQAHYPDPDPNNVGLAIGVSSDKIEGVDVFVPKATYSETMELDEIDDDYRDTLITLVGTINDATFKGWDEDEVLFLGANVTRTGNGPFKLKFTFGISYNTTEMIDTTAGAQTVTKNGWDYLWLEKAQTSGDGGTTVSNTILAVHVAQVYPQADFSLLGV